MTKLAYTFRNDTLFKSLFVKYPDLLKRLVADLLGIKYESIGKFEITNPEMPPEAMGEKFTRLDINMTVNGQRVDLEIQVKNEHDYPERTLFHWAREYSTALSEGMDYINLPRVVIISIISFKLFACKEYHSEFQPLEVTRHTPLTDRMALHFFELTKLPKTIKAEDNVQLWLKLFKANTEEDIKKIEALEVPIMDQAITAYRSVTATDEFRTLERMRSDARHNEAAALGNVRRRVEKKWQGVVVKKDELLAVKDELLADKDARIAELEAQLSNYRDA